MDIAWNTDMVSVLCDNFIVGVYQDPDCFCLWQIIWDPKTVQFQLYFSFLKKIQNVWNRQQKQDRKRYYHTPPSLKHLLSHSSFPPCRFTYSDLCVQVPEPKLRPCLLKTLESLFSLMCSYYAIMSFSAGDKVTYIVWPSLLLLNLHHISLINRYRVADARFIKSK